MAHKPRIMPDQLKAMPLACRSVVVELQNTSHALNTPLMLWHTTHVLPIFVGFDFLQWIYINRWSQWLVDGRRRLETYFVRCHCVVVLMDTSRFYLSLDFSVLLPSCF